MALHHQFLYLPVPCTASLARNTVEAILLDFWEKIGGEEEGNNDFMKKKNVRRGLLGKIKGSTYVGVYRTFEKYVDNGER
mgnify:CR=1 FL=1